jgi:hypothetical protein
MTKSKPKLDCENRHVRQQPSYQEAQEPSDELADDVSKYNHQCYICDKIFSANSNLNRHLRKIHQETVQSPYNNVKCALCESQYPSSSLYIRHLEKDHQVVIEVEQLKFDNKETFDNWKHSIESQTTSQFIKSRGEKRTKNVNKTYYSCNRSGYFVSKAKTQKALKKQGSRKINGRCPASMNVTVNQDSSYDVRFIKTHVGHDFELIHLDLSEKDRDLIVGKLESGITKRDIIRQIRTTSEVHQSTFIATTNTATVTTVPVSDSPSSSILSGLSSSQPIVINSRSSIPGCKEHRIEVVVSTTSDIVTPSNSKNSEALVPSTSPNEAAQGQSPATSDSKSAPQQISSLAASSRLHLATTKDIHNILNSKHLDSKKIRHNYDLNTVEHWIQEMNEFGEESTTVLFYKDQGKLSEQFPKLRHDDFVLAIMKTGQAEALKRWASKCIIIDSTHNVHCEYLHLTYMSVLDETNRIFPVAFMFSTRTDIHTLEVFYTLIHDKVGQITTRTLIADDLHDFYQAWWKVMSMPLHNLPAPWTVLDGWKKKYDLIKNREKLRKIKKQLKALLYETESDKFNKALKQIMSDFKRDPETSEYMEYFERQFAKNPDVWSSCLRKTFGVSNQQLMMMHEKFKTVYKEGKNSKKMCKYVTCLMELFEEHQMKELMQVEESNLPAKRKANLGRHEKGAATGSSVYEVAVEPAYWLCPSECLTDVYDEVRQNLESKTAVRTMRKCCELTCPECKTCRHQYKCTCLDYVVNLNMCKHIHRISALGKQV